MYLFYCKSSAIMYINTELRHDNSEESVKRTESLHYAGHV